MNDELELDMSHYHTDQRTDGTIEIYGDGIAPIPVGKDWDQVSLMLKLLARAYLAGRCDGIMRAQRSIREALGLR